MLNELVDFWARCPLAGPPYMHPDDEPVLRMGGGAHANFGCPGFGDFLASDRFGDPEDHRLHLSLLPAPYIGDLKRAEIVILLLNPGFSYSDYWAEYRNEDFRRRAEATIRQDFAGIRSPFMFLDPELCWHSGFAWWERKLRALAWRIACERFGGRYREALEDLARRLAAVDLVPYHSPSFKAQTLILRLPSVHRARAYARSLAADDQATPRTIIVTRGVREFGLSLANPRVITYTAGQARGASLGPETKGGRAILATYGLV